MKKNQRFLVIFIILISFIGGYILTYKNINEEEREGLEYYLNLNYEIEMVKDGDKFIVYYPQLGRYTFIATGDSVDEAISELESKKKEKFKIYIAQKIKIPKPK